MISSFARLRRWLGAALLLPPAVPLGVASAQVVSRADSVARLGEFVVTAERTRSAVARSTAAVTRLSVDSLRALPVQTVAGALALVPGLSIVHFDAMGDAPQLAVRGFYGGGETEYMVVLLDGVPITGFADGQVNWDLVPLVALESIEIVRGNASALYGDAAVSGVVNLITRRAPGSNAWRLSAGSEGMYRVSGAIGRTLGGHNVSAFADARSTDGYRRHEQRKSGTVGGSLSLVQRPDASLTVSSIHHLRDIEDPGPLSEAALGASRRAESPFFRFDGSEEQTHRLLLDGAKATASGGRLSGYVTGEYNTRDQTRTLPLSAEFADTQRRRTNVSRAFGSLQYSQAGTLGGVAQRVVLGGDLVAGRLTSRYRPVVTGDAGGYAESDGVAGDATNAGSARRYTAAGFATWEADPTEALRITAGARVDWLGDRHTPDAVGSTPAGPVQTPSRSAFSPRIGVNFRYSNRERNTGHAYLTLGRAFKAPTMDQLFDQRLIPVPFPPFGVSLANGDLLAQQARNLEGGAYHDVVLSPGRYTLHVTASAYDLSMRNELDLDLETFRYINIGRSRHRGVELGTQLRAPANIGVFANVTHQDATVRYGEYDGNDIKNMPRQTVVAGISRAPARGVAVSLMATHQRGIWLDDENSATLPASTRVDLRASVPIGYGRLTVNAQNLLGATYSSNGYVDPSGSGVRFFYPAARRLVFAGFEASW